MSLPRVMVAIPSYRSLPSESFAYITKAIVGNIHKGLITGVSIEIGLYITVARNRLAAEAMRGFDAKMCSHVWWLDDDIMPEEDTLERLLAWEKPVVSGLYYAQECIPIAYDIQPKASRVDPVKYRTDFPREGLVQVDGAGFGCLLMETSVLNEMYEKQKSTQWFQTPPNMPEIDFPGEVGEDIFFFQRLKEMDIPVYLDCGAPVGHVRYFNLSREISDVMDKGIAAMDAEL